MSRWREFIREKTTHEHGLTETVMPVLEPTFDLQSYSKLLLHLWAFYQDFDQLIDWRVVNGIDSRVVKGIDGVRERRSCKLDWLREDIENVGLGHQLGAPTFSESSPQLTDGASIFGALYVSEGSTLGGQLITRHLRRNAVFNQQPLRFFNGYASETALRWREFLEIAESSVEPAHFDRSAAAANLVFRNLRRQLTSDISDPPQTSATASALS